MGRGGSWARFGIACALALAIFLLASWTAQAPVHAVVSRGAIIAGVWGTAIRPLLSKLPPNAMGDENKEAPAYALLGPQPPCGTEPIPPIPGLDASAIVKSWSKTDFGSNWRPPACTGWTAMGFATLVTIGARFRTAAEGEGLLRHMGAISELSGVRYWSTKNKQWQTLIVDAYAVTDSQTGQRRADFAPEEMKKGKIFYFEQVDNLSGKVMYRMQIAEASAGRVVVEVENVSTVHYLFLTLFHPGELQTVYFLDRESENVWRYYSIVRIGVHASRIVSGNESSTVNRAVAFYRHFVGIPTDREPPAVR